MPTNEAIFAAFHEPPEKHAHAAELIGLMDETDRRLLEMAARRAGWPECAKATGLSVENARIRHDKLIQFAASEMGIDVCLI
jgi:hypothetical protein